MHIAADGSRIFADELTVTFAVGETAPERFDSTRMIGAGVCDNDVVFDSGYAAGCRDCRDIQRIR